MKDVFVTDHSTPAPKRITATDEEDNEFYEYQKAIEEYNGETKSNDTYGHKQAKYPKGSLMQRMFDPLCGAPRDKMGTILYTVEEKELDVIPEETLRKMYEVAKSKQEVWDAEDDYESLKYSLYQELADQNSPFNQDEWQ